MPIIQENPTYFSDKSAASQPLNTSSVRRQNQQKNQTTIGARRKTSLTSCDDTEDGSEMETFLSSYESNNSYSGSENRVLNGNLFSYNINKGNGYSSGSLRKSDNANRMLSLSGSHVPQPNQPQLKSGMSSLSRLGQLFKKSKSKSSVGSDSHTSTVESSGLGSPMCTPDSSLSIYTNSLDGDSHSSNNSNQISPKHLEESMEDRFCSTYTFDDCGIFAANMYYNVGESSVFTIYHQHANGQSRGRGPSTSSSKSAAGSSGKEPSYDDRISDQTDELEDSVQRYVQPYFKNPTFSTFPNPKRSSIASAASTTTSSFVGIGAECSGTGVNEKTATSSKSHTLPSHLSVQHDRDGYLKPNEPRNLRNVKNLYINDAVVANANRNGQVQQVEVDVHTPTSASLTSANHNSFTDGFNSSAASAYSSGSARYQFDSAGSTTSAATTLVAGGSNNFLFGLPEDDTCNGNIGSDENGKTKSNTIRPLPVYMNRAYFDSTSSASRGTSQRIFSSSAATDCEPYCSLCASSIMGSPRQRSKMDVVIVNCKECFFSRQAETHIRGFFDKLMKEDKQKMDVALKTYDLKDLDHPTDRVVVHSAKVQIVIISHHFLQRLKDEASRRPRLSPINRVFRSKNVIAVLMAVTAQEVLDGYESVLPRYKEWFSVDLRSTNKYDPEFCKKFTDQVVRIYKVELSNSSNFSVFPKKVTREQPKITIMFKKAVEENDVVHVELKTSRQIERIEDVKMENPHTILIRIPDSLSPDREAIVDVSVFVNKSKVGGSRIKSELNLRRFDDDEVDRMAKVLTPFIEFLDKHIADILLKHYKECTDYTADPELELMNGIIICKADILPTIMHFAAYYNLPKTAFTVLEEADGLAHCNYKNELDETPSDIAFTRGHAKIGQLIRDYQEISNSYIAYRYIKELVEKDTEAEDGVPDALEAQPIETEYKLENEDIGADTADSSEATSEHDAQNEEMVEVNIEEEPESVLPNDSTSEIEQSSKAADANETLTIPQRLIPTPSTRRASKPRRKEYVNVDGNPADNPELVQQREKKNRMPPHVAKQKRISMRQAMENYDIPRGLDTEYKLPPPEARPIRDDMLYGPVFKAKNSGTHVTPSGYLIIEDGGLDAELEKRNASKSDEQSATIGSGSACVAELQKEVTPERKISSQQDRNNNGGSGSDSGSSSHEVHPVTRKNTDLVLDPADAQLIDLMRIYKEKGMDMNVVELLFQHWQQRDDVKKSIEEKMKMLDKLREEYKVLQDQNKGSKKPSAMDRLKNMLSLKKKSVKESNSGESQANQRKISDGGRSLNGISSPTALTFTGPNLPTQPFNNTVQISSVPPSPPPVQTPYQFNMQDGRIVSDISYRTSYGSRESDSSGDSDKFHPIPAVTGKPVPPLPLVYKNPMSQRFIPQYVPPNPSQLTASQRADVDDIEVLSQPQTQSPSESYQVPPPPRPVKPVRKPVPAIPVSEDLLKPPPAIPAKPSNRYLETEATSPPPAPPPRNQNISNQFEYVDYKRKNEEPNEKLKSSGFHKSYENMNDVGSVN